MTSIYIYPLFQFSYIIIFLYSLCLLVNNQSVLSSKVNIYPLSLLYNLCITAIKSINIVSHVYNIFIYKEYCPIFIVIGQIYSNFELLEAIFQHWYKFITIFMWYFFVYYFRCLSNSIKFVFIYEFIHPHLYWIFFYPAVKFIFSFSVFHGYSKEGF